jgi:hypothetical protein
MRGCTVTPACCCHDAALDLVVRDALRGGEHCSTHLVDATEDERAAAAAAMAGTVLYICEHVSNECSSSSKGSLMVSS